MRIMFKANPCETRSVYRGEVYPIASGNCTTIRSQPIDCVLAFFVVILRAAEDLLLSN
jgi:hypothetical protein